VLDHKYTPSITELKNRLLQDNPKLWWDTDLIAKTVEEYVKKWKIDAIITFDDGGVSGHINHRAVSSGVRFTPFLHLILNDRHYVLSKTPILPAYQLTTVFVLRKYSILLDLPIVLLFSIPRLLITMFRGDEFGSWGLMVASPNMYFTARGAFEQHASQVVWDRYSPSES